MSVRESATSGPFQRKPVERCLGAWWDKKMNSPLLRRRSSEECRRSGGTVFDIQPELSSNQAVPVLLELEDIVGFEPSKKVIRPGGYRNRDEFIQDMCSRIEKEYRERPARAGAPSTAKEANVHAGI